MGPKTERSLPKVSREKRGTVSNEASRENYTELLHNERTANESSQHRRASISSSHPLLVLLQTSDSSSRDCMFVNYFTTVTNKEMNEQTANQTKKD